MTDHPAQKHGRDMTTGSIPRHLIMFSIPMLAGNVIQTAYGFVNAFWVGKRLGEGPLAAVTGSFPVIFLLDGSRDGPDHGHGHPCLAVRWREGVGSAEEDDPDFDDAAGCCRERSF